MFLYSHEAAALTPFYLARKEILPLSRKRTFFSTLVIVSHMP